MNIIEIENLLVTPTWTRQVNNLFQEPVEQPPLEEEMRQVYNLFQDLWRKSLGFFRKVQDEMYFFVVGC